jgi:hypothetical protein
MLRRFACATALAVAVTSCSGPPEKEYHQAEGALAAARAADAATYAPDELKTAEAALAQYDGAVSQRDYLQALRMALEARDGAYEAAKRAGDEKAAARSQAESLLAEVDALARAGNARLTGAAGPRPSGAAADRLRNTLHPVPAALQEARSRLDRQDYRGAIATLTPIAEALRRQLTPPGAAAGRKGR